MPDQPTPAPQGANNPRNNPRNHAKPTRRRATPGAAAHTPQGVPAAAPMPTGAAQEAVQASAPAAPVPSQPQPHWEGQPVPPSRTRQGGYAGYAQTVGANPRVSPAHKIDGQMAPYADLGRYKKRGKKKAGIVSVIAMVVILAAIGAGVYMYLNPPTFNITVNGMTRTVDKGTTVADMVADGVVTPKAGNLLAVDGEVIEEGAGTAFGATVNDNEVTDPATELHKNDVVQIVDGTDITEEYDAEAAEVQPGQVELGEGAIHVYIPGEVGQTEKRTGKVSGKTVDEVTKPVQDNVYLQYNADTGDDKVVALTFDDGPWPTTEELLDVLRENEVKATFFTIGEQIADYPSAMEKEAADGHQICTHSWDHASGSGNGVDLTRMSAEEQIEEVQKGQQAIADVTGKDASKVIRSPGGNYHGDIVWTLQPYVTAEINWNVDTEDWRRPGSDAIAERIKSARPGDIVLMHDGGGDRSQTIEALRTALPYLKEQGFKFVTIDELMAYNDPKEIAKSLAGDGEGDENGKDGKDGEE